MLMKKLFALLAVALLAVACGGPATPGDTALDFYNLVAEGNFEGAAEYVAYNGATPEENAEQKAMIVSLFKEKAAPNIESKGGVASITVVNESVAEDGKTADVDLKVVYGDGSEQNESLALVLTEEGDWKLSMEK